MHLTTDLAQYHCPLPTLYHFIEPTQDFLVPWEVPSSETKPSYTFQWAAVRSNRLEGAITCQARKRKVTKLFRYRWFHICLLFNFTSIKNSMCKPSHLLPASPKQSWLSTESLKIYVLAISQVLDKNIKYKRGSHRNSMLIICFLSLNASFIHPLTYPEKRETHTNNPLPAFLSPIYKGTPVSQLLWDVDSYTMAQ